MEAALERQETTEMLSNDCGTDILKMTEKSCSDTWHPKLPDNNSAFDDWTLQVYDILRHPGEPLSSKRQDVPRSPAEQWLWHLSQLQPT